MSILNQMNSWPIQGSLLGPNQDSNITKNQVQTSNTVPIPSGPGPVLTIRPITNGAQVSRSFRRHVSPPHPHIRCTHFKTLSSNPSPLLSFPSPSPSLHPLRLPFPCFPPLDPSPPWPCSRSPRRHSLDLDLSRRTISLRSCPILCSPSRIDIALFP